MSEAKHGGSDRPVAWRATAELLDRYDRPGPRYTSYPTAVEFEERVDAEVYRGKLAELARSDGPISVYIHLPFCNERCFFCGCNVIISPHKERAEPYLDLLKAEIDMLAARLPGRRISQLHLGGGTPTYFAPDRLIELVRHLVAVYTIAPGAELAFEADPRVTTDEHLDALASVGFNRISLGVQDFTAGVQEAVNRRQSVAQTAHLVESARKLGYSGINIDLIYGLPRQELESFGRTVDTVIDIGADRSAVYSFAHVPWMHAHMRKIRKDELPSRETKFGLFGVARQRFLEAGYTPIGMDHFSKPDDELSIARRERRLTRNFQGYSVVPAENTVGLGISAIGDLAGAYIQNYKKLSRYGEAVGAGRFPVERGIVLDEDDLLRRAVIRELMCNFAIDVPAVERRHGIVFGEYFAKDLARLREHAAEGMVEIRPDGIHATPLGELFVRNLAMCFDRYQWEKHESRDAPTFSRTV